MTECETSLQRSARVACGWGASIYGDSTPGQWDYLARWSGYDCWDELVAAVGPSHGPPPDVKPMCSKREDRALAAVERRTKWENFGR